MIYLKETCKGDPLLEPIDHMSIGQTFLWNEKVHLKIAASDHYNLVDDVLVTICAGHEAQLVRVNATFIPRFVPKN